MQRSSDFGGYDGQATGDGVRHSVSNATAGSRNLRDLELKNLKFTLEHNQKFAWTPAFAGATSIYDCKGFSMGGATRCDSLAKLLPSVDSLKLNLKAKPRVFD
jgi:hypothetical protein